jgi:hypothetical protein
VSGPFAEREVSPILVATTPERVVRLVLVVERFPERVFTVVVSVERFPERVFMFPESVFIFPVAVARFCWRVRMFPVAVARLIPRFEIIVSWIVFDPWIFWNAWRMLSAAVIVPEAAENPVRTEVRLSFPENAR